MSGRSPKEKSISVRISLVFSDSFTNIVVDVDFVFFSVFINVINPSAVSYTHLDVYKRQL